MKYLKIVGLLLSVISINCRAMRAEFTSIERFDTEVHRSFEAVRNGMAISVTYDKTTGLYYGSESDEEGMRLLNDVEAENLFNRLNALYREPVEKG